MFDKLQNYSAERKQMERDIESKSKTGVKRALDEIYDVKTPLGYFMHKLQSLGYTIIEEVYKSKDGFPDISFDDYSDLSEEEASEYERVVSYTELHDILMTDGDQLILSAAGCGKTTALVFTIMKDIVTGEATKIVSIPDGEKLRVVDSIFVGTFLNSGAKELEKSSYKWQRTFGYTPTADKVHFGTLHAEFTHVLNALGVKKNIAERTTLMD